jgi:nuclear control of ATPase protein 2
VASIRCSRVRNLSLGKFSLKSVFSNKIRFVGLTPGILVSFAGLRWFFNVFGSRQGAALGRQKGRMLGVLRNIDRVLTAAQPSDDGVLYYKDYGLLLCESHVLRQLAMVTIPEDEMREFLMDLDELTDMSIGVERQRDVTRRMRWGYASWL